jgi:LysM repeat protein
MKRPLIKGRRRFRYAKSQPNLWGSLERFHTMSLRLAGFLHQFKTPLHVIQSQAELLLEDPALHPNVRRSIKLMHQNAGRLATQTQNLMDAARGSKSSSEIAPVEHLIENICQAAETDCRKRNIVLEKEVVSQSPIWMDPIALEGALHNLVNNAIEAMPEGGHLRIGTFQVPSSRRVGIEIADTGKGMDSAAFKQVMKTPFQSSKAGGTGLGLYITHHILRRHKASVKWENNPGKGMKVTILFPMESQPPVSQTHSLPVPLKTESNLWRRLLGAFAVLPFVITSLSAATYPQLLRLQGHFTDTKVPLTDNLPVRFSIWDTEDGYGNLLWEDVQNVSIKEDTFQVVLGRLKALSPNVFSGGDRWLEMQIGADAPMRPRHKIPNQYLQAQVAAVQAAPPPMVVPPPVPTPAPELTAQERRDLELQIEKYKEPEKEPAKSPKKKHVVVPVEDTSELGTTYDVKPGDTLKSIAQKLYGKSDLWYDLYYLNRDRLGPMGYLSPGQILVLPSITPGVPAK